MQVERLLRDHCKLRLLGADLMAVVSSPIPCDFKQLARRRWDLARTVHMHLAYEERHLFARLENDVRADVRAAATRAKRGVEILHSLYKSHIEHWTEREVTTDWPRFQAAVRHLVFRMIERIDREEAELFPFVARGESVERTWQPGMRNWAGVGVALQPLIVGTAVPAQSASVATRGD